MEFPFYRSKFSGLPRYSQNYRPIPVATGAQTVPRVVSIPVDFIQSRSDSALLIQKIWRGYRVRKSVNKIRDVQRDVDEADRLISDSATVAAIGRDQRERLKLSERLMALLFRLDSVPGFDIPVKDLRKTVIRRAILLQEKVDSIASVDQPIDECLDSESESRSSETSPSTIQDNPEEEEEKRSSSLERVMEGNNRLMKLMADLQEKSEMQTKILNSLCKRVGQLENAFAGEKLCRRLKKKKTTRKSDV